MTQTTNWLGDQIVNHVPALRVAADNQDALTCRYQPGDIVDRVGAVLQLEIEHHHIDGFIPGHQLIHGTHGRHQHNSNDGQRAVFLHG